MEWRGQGQDGWNGMEGSGSGRLKWRRGGRVWEVMVSGSSQRGSKTEEECLVLNLYVAEPVTYTRDDVHQARRGVDIAIWVRSYARVGRFELPCPINTTIFSKSTGLCIVAGMSLFKLI